MSASNSRVFYFHADASALGGCITHPREQVLEAHSSCSLPQAGGAAHSAALTLRYDQLLSAASARTEVSGAARAQGGGWTTLVTSTVEDLNLLDVVKADRLTARLSVEHPSEGYVPRVSLIGTSIENLRVGGEPVQVSIHPTLLDPGSDAADIAWPERPAFLQSALKQSEKIADAAGLPEPLRRRYAWVGSEQDRKRKGYVLCSAVEEVKGRVSGSSVGHILVIPDFGVLLLAELLVSPAAFLLTMLRAELDCSVQGTVGIATAHINGRPMP